ncbi:DUF6364 family protein [Pararcticibacter amylolyticus]|uniref:Antitoxin n=1 Tax=Pararcticibacter amylolyticus TaxID=2173175 RepID=A0A2U2PAB1_9SPHI|nr:DUF6364 family protein [Pararcticibacter amylolyticus]PWG78331.1 hypothetical protein DDR33_22930 [Pararcticibacter amylolyticus]
MKTRLNLTIDESVLARVKSYAESKKISISELVERYFKSLSKPEKQKNIFEMVDDLPASSFDVNIDLKNAFYEDQAEKYGA